MLFLIHNNNNNISDLGAFEQSLSALTIMQIKRIILILILITIKIYAKSLLIYNNYSKLETNIAIIIINS